MWSTGLVAQQHVGSSQTRALTHVPCIGRQIPNHCATREAPQISYLKECSPTTHTHAAALAHRLGRTVSPFSRRGWLLTQLWSDKRGTTPKARARRAPGSGRVVTASPLGGRGSRTSPTRTTSLALQPRKLLQRRARLRSPERHCKAPKHISALHAPGRPSSSSPRPSPATCPALSLSHARGREDEQLPRA